jgi:predicted peptidase
MQNRIVSFLILFLVMSSTLFAQKTQQKKPQKTPPPFKKFLYLDKKDTLPYGILEPLNPVPGQKYPLVIFLHGAGERGKDNDNHLKHIQILFSKNTLDKYPCYVFAPQCPENKVWSEMMFGKSFSTTPTRPMQMLIQALEKVSVQYPIDHTRIYVTGVSMGAFGTWDLLARFPYRFAAAVPICGGGDVKTIPSIKHIPVWAFHGAEDPTVSPELSRKMIQGLQEAGALPGYTEYPGVKHASWHHAYKEPQLMPWLWKQKQRFDK